MAGLDMALLCSFELMLVAAALFDARSYRIPNPISVALLGAFAVHFLAGGAGHGLTSALVALAVAVVFGGGLWLLGVWGGGDAKLLAAMAPWVGLAGMPRLVLVMALAGGALAALVLVKARLGASEAQPRHLPYGIALALAGTDWFLSRLG